MARVPQVTRTIQTTVVNVLCADTELGELVNKEFTLPRTYKDEDALLKAVRKIGETATIKPVSVVASKIVETLYGMSEQKFIELAEVLPPRGTKADATEAVNE